MYRIKKIIPRMLITARGMDILCIITEMKYNIYKSHQSHTAQKKKNASYSFPTNVKYNHYKNVSSVNLHSSHPDEDMLDTDQIEIQDNIK